jgi:hypothetical protein
MTTSLATYSPELVDLVQWLERQFQDNATRLVLRQRAEDGIEQMVREFQVPGGSADAHALAMAIHKRANEDGRLCHGRILYGVFSYRGGDYLDRFFFGVQGEQEEPFSVSARDATLGGVTAQLMRHNEANARLAIGQTIDVIGHYKSLLIAREKRIEELEAKYSRVIELYERLSSLQHERDLEIMRVKQTEKGQEFLREKFEMLAPVILSKFIPGANKGGVLAEELVRQFLKSLSPKQMEGLMGTLSPEQFAVINEIYSAYGERDLAREDAKKNGKKNGSAHGTSGTNGASGH